MSRIIPDRQWHQWDSAVYPAMQRFRKWLIRQRAIERHKIELRMARVVKERKKFQLLLRSARKQRRIVLRYMKMIRYLGKP